MQEIDTTKPAYKLRENNLHQEKLEYTILNYQKALASGNARVIDTAYKVVCKLYPPMMHLQEWYQQYHYLYDSLEDFQQDYIRIFCNVLSAWKPRNVRKMSRYDGTGEFKNYFIGALQHNYINLVKADNAGKRNPSCRCPICDKWVNPLSTHLRTHHIDLLWEQLLINGHDIEKLKHCPFCKSHKLPRSYDCLVNEGETCDGSGENCEECKKNGITKAIKKHMLSKHSSLLFNRFNELYPNYQTVSPRAMSVYGNEDEEGEETCFYDKVEERNNLNALMCMDLNDIENKIISNVLNGTLNIKFDASVYNCSIEEFSKAIDGLKDKLSLAGLEI